jgi:hypothetical protein
MYVNLTDLQVGQKFEDPNSRSEWFLKEKVTKNENGEYVVKVSRKFFGAAKTKTYKKNRVVKILL